MKSYLKVIPLLFIFLQLFIVNCSYAQSKKDFDTYLIELSIKGKNVQKNNAGQNGAVSGRSKLKVEALYSDKPGVFGYDSEEIFNDSLSNRVPQIKHFLIRLPKYRPQSSMSAQKFQQTFCENAPFPALNVEINGALRVFCLAKPEYTYGRPQGREEIEPDYDLIVRRTKISGRSFTLPSDKLNEKFALLEVYDASAKLSTDSKCTLIPNDANKSVSSRKRAKKFALCDVQNAKSKYIKVLDGKNDLQQLLQTKKLNSLKSKSFGNPKRIQSQLNKGYVVTYKDRVIKLGDPIFKSIAFEWQKVEIKFDQDGLVVPRGLNARDISVTAKGQKEYDLMWSQKSQQFVLTSPEPELIVEYDNQQYSFTPGKGLPINQLVRLFSESQKLNSNLIRWKSDPYKPFKHGLKLAKDVTIKAKKKGRQIVLSLNDIPWNRTEFAVRSPIQGADEQLNLEGWIVKSNRQRIGQLDSTNRIDSRKIHNAYNSLQGGKVFLHPPKKGKSALLESLSFVVNKGDLEKKNHYALKEVTAKSKKVALDHKLFRGIAPITLIDLAGNMQISLIDQVDKFNIKPRKIEIKDKSTGKVKGLPNGAPLDLYKVRSVTPLGVNTFGKTVVTDENAQRFSDVMAKVVSNHKGGRSLSSSTSQWRSFLTKTRSGVDVYVSDTKYQPTYKGMNRDISAMPHSVISSHYRTMPGRFAGDLQVWNGGNWATLNDKSNYFSYAPTKLNTNFILISVEDIDNYQQDSGFDDGGGDADFLDDDAGDSGAIATGYDMFEVKWGRLSKSFFQHLKKTQMKNTEVFIMYAQGNELQFKNIDKLQGHTDNDLRKFLSIDKSLLSNRGNFQGYKNINETTESELRKFATFLGDEYKPNANLYFIKPGGSKIRLKRYESADTLFNLNVLSGLLDAPNNSNFSSVFK